MDHMLISPIYEDKDHHTERESSVELDTNDA